jgi:hypothetical protein
MMSDYKVEMINDGMQEFYVEFNGPKESKQSKSSVPIISFYCFLSLIQLFLKKMFLLVG